MRDAVPTVTTPNFFKKELAFAGKGGILERTRNDSRAADFLRQKTEEENVDN